MKTKTKEILKKLKNAKINPWDLDFELQFNTNYLAEEEMLTKAENEFLMEFKPNSEEILQEFYGEVQMPTIPEKIQEKINTFVEAGYNPSFIAREVLFQYTYDREFDAIEEWITEDKEEYLEDSVKKIYLYALKKQKIRRKNNGTCNRLHCS